MEEKTTDHTAGRAADRAARVLIVDDDERLQAVVREFLSNYGYEVSSLGSGKGLRESMESFHPDILLLDVMLPGQDGFAILRELRSSFGPVFSKTPAIMLTACGDETDRIIGLEIGADDYLPKPFNPRELLARIKAVLRRAPAPEPSAATPASGASTQEQAKPDDPETLRVDAFILDGRRQRLTRAGQHVELSGAEYRILSTFMRHAGEILSRDRLLSLAFGDDHYVTDRNIDVYISRLRAILRNLGETETRIRTVWGSGYSWVKDGD